METAFDNSAIAGSAREFLTFTLGREEYGIDILKVQEIRGYDAVTHIANTPEFIRGVINLRGHIVPIVDLRIRFGLSEPRYDAFTVVIILNIGTRIVGIVVDSVSDVMTLRAEQIRPAPEFSSTLGTEYLLGLGALEDRMVILVDIACLLEGPEMGLSNPETAIQSEVATA
ncbi:MAG: chemotaxis protein CheW [Pseudomonadota bacterium]|nr:chemotaxis protein CheW [Pseudomonadota bacterium]